MKRVDLEVMLVAMYDGKLPQVRLNEDGSENPDPTPMAPPLGYKKQPSMVDIVRNMVRSERLAVEAMSQGLETFEEADDFEVGDDFDPSSPYENDFEPPVRELRRRLEEEEKELLTKENEGAIEEKPDKPAKKEKVPHGKLKDRSERSGDDADKVGSDSV